MLRTVTDNLQSNYVRAVVNTTSLMYVSVHCSLNLNSVNQLIFVMVKCGVLFEVRTEFLNNI
jgi:hypothetical protein